MTIAFKTIYLINSILMISFIKVCKIEIQKCVDCVYVQLESTLESGITRSSIPIYVFITTSEMYISTAKRFSRNEIIGGILSKSIH